MRSDAVHGDVVRAVPEQATQVVGHPCLRFSRQPRSLTPSGARCITGGPKCLFKVTTATCEQCAEMTPMRKRPLPKRRAHKIRTGV
jgi:hypothetical protein